LNLLLGKQAMKNQNCIAVDDRIIDMNAEDSAQLIIDSLTQYRFAIVKNHAVSTDLLKQLYHNWEKFFLEDKKIDYLRSDITDEGYVPINTEKAVGYNVADLKEYYQTHSQSTYPEVIDGNISKKLVAEIVNLGCKIIRHLDSALPITVSNSMTMTLSDMISNCDRHGFRVIHYPTIDEEQTINSPSRSGDHTDICLLTIIPWATADGLELQDSSGTWHSPKIDESDILVFAGDMLEMATNGYLRAAKHRVTANTQLIRDTSRFSFPVFIHPRREVELKLGVVAIDALRSRITEIGFNGQLLAH
jgi:isopenicillin N synthase-like dioxygenase